MAKQSSFFPQNEPSNFFKNQGRTDQMSIWYRDGSEIRRIMIAQKKTEEELLANSAPCSESLTDEVREVQETKRGSEEILGQVGSDIPRSSWSSSTTSIDRRRSIG